MIIALGLTLCFSFFSAEKYDWQTDWHHSNQKIQSLPHCVTITKTDLLIHLGLNLFGHWEIVIHSTGSIKTTEMHSLHLTVHILTYQNKLKHKNELNQMKLPVTAFSLYCIYFIFQTIRHTKILESKFKEKIFYSYLKLRFINMNSKNGSVEWSLYWS